MCSCGHSVGMTKSPRRTPIRIGQDVPSPNIHKRGSSVDRKVNGEVLVIRPGGRNLSGFGKVHHIDTAGFSVLDALERREFELVKVGGEHNAVPQHTLKRHLASLGCWAVPAASHIPILNAASASLHVLVCVMYRCRSGVGRTVRYVPHYSNPIRRTKRSQSVYVCACACSHVYTFMCS